MSITKGAVVLELQPGGVIESDGEGLLTSRLNFRGEKGAEASRPTTGTAHPFDPRLQCYRSSYTMDASWVMVTADYVGIESGESTKTKFSVDFSSSTQPIKAHPNFLKATFNTTEPLKNLGWDEERQMFPESDGQAAGAGLVGVQSFLAPEQAITGTWYTSNKADLQPWVDAIGQTTMSGLGGEIVLMSQYAPISPKHRDNIIITGVAYESYAHLWKITFTARVASGGWNLLIYKSLDSNLVRT